MLAFDLSHEAIYIKAVYYDSYDNNKISSNNNIGQLKGQVTQVHFFQANILKCHLPGWSFRFSIN